MTALVRSSMVPALMACGLLLGPGALAAGGIEEKPEEVKQAARERAPAPAGQVEWDGAGEDEAAAAERRAARSAAAEEALREREGPAREYRYLPTTPLLRDAAKRQREAARRQAEGKRSPDAPRVAAPSTVTTVGPATPGGVDGATLFVAIAAVGAVAGVVMLRRWS